jgi:endonuclease/exonuclease/phosphatase family metal-dependent hydrolase
VKPRAAAAGTTSLRVCTYNVHRGRGLDGRLRPSRIVDVLREVDADVYALQEVVCADAPGEENQGRYFAEALGYHYELGENRRLNGHAYGNVALSRFPLRAVTNHDISIEGYERRGVLHTDVFITETDVLHVFNVHLGTAFVERRHQARRLCDRGEGNGILLNDELTGPRIVLGDFNEWTPGLATRLLGTHLRSVDIRAHLGRSKTYPAFLPFLHLDHIYFDGPIALRALELHRTRKALVASDHLPLVAEFDYAGPIEEGARLDGDAPLPSPS